jgi:hypothetical protein
MQLHASSTQPPVCCGRTSTFTVCFACPLCPSQEASAAADAARQEAGSARAALSASQSHAQALQARLSAKAAELSGLSGREETLKERANDLQAFVEVSGSGSCKCSCVLALKMAGWHIEERCRCCTAAAVCGAVGPRTSPAGGTPITVLATSAVACCTACIT